MRVSFKTTGFLFGIAILVIFFYGFSFRKSNDVYSIHSLLITSPKILEELENAGANLAHKLDGSELKVKDNDYLLKLPLYRDLVEQIRRDLVEQKNIISTESADSNQVYTSFNFNWLISPQAHFELVGLVNRFDRMLLQDSTKAGHCGETRLIYRLAYDSTTKGSETSSRLPMTLALVYQWPKAENDQDCRIVSQRARLPTSESQISNLLSFDSIYYPFLTQALSFKNLEINMQLIRRPAVEGSNLAEQTQYLMRAFEINSATNKLVSIPLENTPDVERLKKDDALRNDLLSYLLRSESLAAIKKGNVIIPERFLAKKAISVAPFGLSRKENRPFRQLFSNDEIQNSLALRAHTDSVNPEATIRRLDSLSCVGCHQSRSIAGFHLLGEGKDPSSTYNSMALPYSTYFESVIGWREKSLSNFLSHREISDLPITEIGLDHFNGYGARCGTKHSALSENQCQAGYQCYTDFPDFGDGVGQCFPETIGGIGDPCEPSAIQWQHGSGMPTIQLKETLSCGRFGLCAARTAGFPSGMCATGCDQQTPQSVCQLTPILDAFGACLATGKSFQNCLASNSQMATLRACGPKNPCRDDYVCAKGTGSQSFCAPTYFLPQLSIENHGAIGF